MIKFKNESGAALVFTLMIITLLLLFIMTLLYQVTNTTKQITTTEKEIVSEQIAKMGVEYYRTYIETLTPGNVTSMEEIVEMEFDKNIIMELDDKLNFKFEIVGQDPEPVIDSSNGVTIPFTSIGWAYGKDDEIESSITIYIESEE